jgi:hypothetical protein
MHKLYGEQMKKIALFFTVGMVFIMSGFQKLQAATDDAAKYSIKDGMYLVQEGVAQPEIEIYELDSTLVSPETSIAYWAVIKQDADEGNLKIIFFSKDKKSVASLLLKDEFYCSSILPSPDGKKVLLDTGNPRWAERNFTLFDLDTGKSEMSFATLRGMDPRWVDVHRFVYTLVDVAENRDFIAGKNFGYTFSIGFYDSLSSGNTILKASDDTHDYSFERITDDGGGAIITETWVENVADWKSEDENKIKKREVVIEFPAAG